MTFNIQHMIDIHEATPEDLARAQRARSPVSYLTEEQFNSLKGQLVALLLDGPDKGTVIAHAPLDFGDPSKPRKAVRDQVAASPYANRRYQVGQILDTQAATPS